MMTKKRATVNWNLKGADSPSRDDRPGQPVEGAVGAVVEQSFGGVFGERRQGADCRTSRAVSGVIVNPLRFTETERR